MGLVMNELKIRKPELVYFDETYTGAYPEEPPFTLMELEELYPLQVSVPKKMMHIRQMPCPAPSQPCSVLVRCEEGEGILRSGNDHGL